MTSVGAADSYITARNPEKFGGKQEIYVLHSNRAIEAAIDQITTGVSEGKDLTALFFEVLDELGRARQAVAIVQGTENSICFGRRRTEELSPSEAIASRTVRFISPSTFMDSSDYEEYNRLFMDRLHGVLSKMEHDKVSFSETTRVEKKTVLGRKNQFSVEILTPEMARQVAEIMSIEEIRAAVGIDESYCETILEFGHSKELMRLLKAANPEIYKKLKMSHHFSKLVKRYPSPKIVDDSFGGYKLAGNFDNLKSLYVLATNRLEIDGKMYAMSQYLTWMYCDWKKDPVERMKDRSTVMVIHQDSFLVEDTLNDIARIFKEVVLWNSEGSTIRDLIDKIALIRYEFAHCMPFDRGSAAIGEWLESALYRYHGFRKFSHSKDALADLEALTSLTLEDFMKRYELTIHLEF